jgi:hypothetical protein
VSNEEGTGDVGEGGVYGSVRNSKSSNSRAKYEDKFEDDEQMINYDEFVLPFKLLMSIN